MIQKYPGRYLNNGGRSRSFEEVAGARGAGVDLSEHTQKKNLVPIISLFLGPTRELVGGGDSGV